jgi:hypothetical protein
MKFEILRKTDDSVRCYTEKVEYNGQYMGESSITVSVKSHIHIQFEINDYLVWRGETYYLNNIPTEKKTGDTKTKGDVFQYDSMKFSSCQSELDNADFNDFVGESQTDISFTAQPNFSFVAATIADLAQRVQVNMDRYYTGDKKWTIIVDSNYTTSEDNLNKLINISNITCWGALALCKSLYDTNFIVSGRTVTIGGSGSVKDITFKVGAYKGLYDMTRNAQADQGIVTKLTSYGNTTNINPRYYSLLSATVSAKVNSFNFTLYDTGLYDLYFIFDLDHETELRNNIVFSVKGKNTLHTFNAKWGSYTKTTTKTLTGTHEVIDSEGRTSTEEYTYEKKDTETYFAYIVTGIGSTEYYDLFYAGVSILTATILSGARKDNISDLSHLSFDVNSKLPNNMNITNLMLPAFPVQTLAQWVETNKSKYSWLQEYVNQGYTFSTDRFYPCIYSKNKAVLGVRPHTEYFTSDDETHKNIYPSLQYFSDSRNKVISCKNYDDTDITDSGVVKDGDSVPKIHITISDLGFEFDDVELPSTKPKLHFNSGYCGGRDFTISNWERDSSNNWVLTAERVKDESKGKYFPYVDAPIKNGDVFVITDIYMPDTYIEQASIELLKWSMKWLAKNDYTVFSYSLNPDTNFIKRHDDLITDKSTTFYKTVKEGDMLIVEDSDIGVTGTVTIDQIKITEGDGILPKYEITLRDTKTVGTYQKVQQQIDALTGNGASTGYNSSQVGDLAYSALKDKFLSKEHDDKTNYSLGIGNDLEVNGVATFGGSAKSKNYADSILSGIGKGWNIDENGRAQMESLILRSFLEVPEVKRRRETVIQGDLIQSCANGKIESVTIDKDENGNQLASGTIVLHIDDNDVGSLEVDDICLSIFSNLSDTSLNATSTADDGKGNRTVKGFATSMFRVTEVSGEKNETIKYVLRAKDGNWTTLYHPQSLATIAQRGNFTNTDRQALNYYGICPKPYIRIMHDVNSWEFTVGMIGTQIGCMENMSAFGLNMTGYSGYMKNIYFDGTIKQIEILGYDIKFNTFGDNMVKEGQTKKIKATVVDGWGADKSSEFDTWKLTRDTGNEAADNIWNASAEITNGVFYITWSSSKDDIVNDSALYTVTAEKSNVASSAVSKTIKL